MNYVFNYLLNKWLRIAFCFLSCAKGTGIAANIFRKSTFEYEFLEKVTELENKYYLDYKIPNKYSILKLQLGTTLNLDSRLALFGDLDAYLDIGARPRHFPYISGLLGLKYLMY